MKRVIHKIINVILCVLSIAIILLAIAVLYAVIKAPDGELPMLGKYTMFQVVSPSMNPELKMDTVVIVKKVEFSDISKGDIISFYSSEPDTLGSVVTHRVDEVVNTDAGIMLYTKGDANVSRDKYPVEEDEYIGMVVHTSDLFGSFVVLVGYGWIFVILIVIPLSYIIISNFLRFRNMARAEAMREMQDEAHIGENEQTPHDEESEEELK